MTDEHLDDSSLAAARRRKLERLAELGIDPWGGRFDQRHWIGDIRGMVDQVRWMGDDGAEVALPPADELERPDFDFRSWLRQHGPGKLVGPRVKAAGRIMLHRDKGKLQFIDIQDWTGRIQLFIGRAQVGDDNWQVVECLDLGDLIGVEGQLQRTQAGELSIFVSHVTMLAKTLDPPPDKHKGLADPDLRQRMRYVDLAYNEGVLQRFQDRTRIVQSVRRTLDRHGYCEVEGPTLHTIAGGAAARPFVTHHNTLDMSLFLRIALELHLKRLMVGGMERVYELGRVYRNEGISPRHNPEFTMLEAYEAYGDYHTMMELTEQIVTDALQAISAGPKVQWGEHELDFTPPFARRTYDELLAEHAAVDARDPQQVADAAGRAGITTANRHPDVVKSDLFEHVVERALLGPIFVLDYPASICPLTKRKASDPSIAERFELYIGGMEIANAYTELNDPDLQQELFQTQLAGLAEEDSMARMDHDFIRALRAGMPPAGGLGIGIDRLVMLLTGSASIRDVILFPLLRPEKDA